MGRITDISRQKRNKTRVNIYIDDEFVCGLDEMAVATARFKIGDEISPERLKELVRASELNSAFERAVGYLGPSPHSKKEVERYLYGKGYDKSVIADTLDKLTQYRYVDDRAFAALYIKSKSKKYGSFRIAAELKQKGVDARIIAELTEGETDNNATDIALKYLKSHRNADKQKLKRFLAGRGFSWDSISSTVSELAERGAFDGGEEEFYDNSEDE